MKRGHCLSVGLLLTLVLPFMPGRVFGAEAATLRWTELPPLPDGVGFGGMFAGTSHGALIVAGGANFPDKPYWEGGKKAWYDTIYVLESPRGSWRKVDARLPRPLGYGVSVTHGDRVICIGGSGAEQFTSEVFSLEWVDGRIRIDRLPSLPGPCAFLAGALLGDTVYIAGGNASNAATEALRQFLALDLSRAPGEQAWQALESWPGPERHLAVAGVQDGSFFLFGGVRLKADGDGKPTRILPPLADAYRYTPAKTRDARAGAWTRIADLPRTALGAPTPAPALGLSHLLIMGGVTAELALMTEPLAHPGFPVETIAYHTGSDTWVRLGAMPPGSSRVTAPTAFWNGRWVIPNGECGPGVRSNRVYAVDAGLRFGAVNWGMLAIYLAVMLGMGAYFSRREKGTEDFFLAGRRIPWWAAGLSIYGTQLSAISFMAVPAFVFRKDLTIGIGSFLILGVAPLVVFCYLPFFRRLNVTTAYEYLEKRFHVSVRLLGSAIFILYQLGRMGIVLFLPAVAIAAVTHIDIFLCIAVMGVFCTIYTVMGGIEAVIWTDVVQVAVLMGGAILCLVLMVWGVEGGLGAVIDIGWRAGKFKMFNWGFSYTELTVWVAVVGFFFMNLIPYTTDQTVVQRYLTTHDEKGAARSIWTNALITIPGACVFWGLGIALYVYYRTNPAVLSAGKAGEILPWFIVQKLPVGIAGTVIAGVFAATMSSMDSSMNSIATAYVTDFHRRFRPGSPDPFCLLLARWITVLVGVVGTGAAMLIAAADVQALFEFFNQALGMLGGSLAGIFFLAVFTRRVGAGAALIGAAVGTVVPWLVHAYTDVNWALYGAIGVTACVGVACLASLVLPERKDLTGLTVHTMKNRPPGGS